MRIFIMLSLGMVASAARTGEPSECVQLAMPLLSENQLVVPATRTELQMVCNKWHEFVDCINTFVARHYSSQQKSAFNHDVETAVKNVYKMCKDPAYSEEYLTYAPCIKRMTTDRDRCGVFYTNMARAVTEGIGSDQEICCLHHKFRTCMSEQPPCDDNRSSPAVVRGFVETFLDNGLHVFKQKCNDMQYVFRSDHCVGARQTRLEETRGTSNTYEDRPVRPDRPRPGYEERPGRPEYVEPRPERPQYTEKRPDRPDRPEYRPEVNSRPDRPDRPGYDGRDEVAVAAAGAPSFVDQQLRPEHRDSDLGVTARTTQRPSTTPYSGWFRPETTTSVWLENNALDDRAQARRQENAAAAAGSAVGFAALTAALLSVALVR